MILFHPGMASSSSMMPFWSLLLIFQGTSRLPCKLEDGCLLSGTTASITAQSGQLHRLHHLRSVAAVTLCSTIQLQRQLHRGVFVPAGTLESGLLVIVFSLLSWQTAQLRVPVTQKQSTLLWAVPAKHGLVRLQ
jgi:hypothetical protein